MKATKSILSAFIIISITAGHLFAIGAGITSVNFMKISQGARQVGMGEAAVGIADDVNAVYWNPAGLSKLTRHQVCLMHSIWLLDVTLEYGAYALPMGTAGTLALQGTFLNAGSILKTTENSAGEYLLTDEKVDASTMNISLAYANRLGRFFGESSFLADISAGLKVNVTTERIYTDEGGGYAANLGFLYSPKYENYSFGLLVENAGVSNNRPSLPLAVKMGFGYNFAFSDFITSLSERGFFNMPDPDSAIGLDVIYYPVEQSARVNAGGEKFWTLNKFHAVGVRIGYKFGYDLGMLAGLTAGLGYRLTAMDTNSVEIDYAITPYGDLGISHRVSLTGKFLGMPERHFYEDKPAAVEYYKKGYELLYKRNYNEALREFGESIKRNKQYAPAYMGIGACYLNTNKRDLAMEAYEKALSLDPNNTKLKEFIDKQKWDGAVQ